MKQRVAQSEMSGWDGNFRRIVVAVDGGPPSRHGATWARLIAQADRGRVTLVAVTDPRARVVPGTMPIAVSEDAKARKIVDVLAREFGAEGLEGTPVFATGDPTDEILRAARLSRAELLVLGSTRAGRRATLGRVCATAFDRAPASVLVARRAPEATPRILAVTDGSDASRPALLVAAKLARAWNAPLVILQLTPEGPSGSIPVDVSATDLAPFFREGEHVELLRRSGPFAATVGRVAAERRAGLVILPKDATSLEYVDTATTSVLAVRAPLA